MRPSCRSALAAASALLLAACGSGGGGEPDPPKRPAPLTARIQAAKPPSDVAQLDGLLSRRALALTRGDAEAYAATATGAQRERDRRAARRTQGIGLEDVALSVRAIDVGPRRGVLSVRSLYRLKGIAGRFSGDRRMVVVKTARGWKVRSETSRRERHPWELTRLTRRRTDHFVILAPAGRDLDGLGATLEQGYRTGRGRLDLPRLEGRTLVVVAGTARDARSLTRGITGVAELAAITDSQVRERGAARRAAEVVSQRLLVVWPVFAALGAEDRTRIVTHELTHAALAGRTSGRTPSWLVEGIALYASDDARVAEAARELDGAAAPPSLGRLARPDAIARSSGAGQSDGYGYASAAAHYLVARFGEAGLLELYDAFNDEAIEGRAGEERTVDRALRAALGISTRRFEQDLRAWIRAGGRGA